MKYLVIKNQKDIYMIEIETPTILSAYKANDDKELTKNC